MELPETLTQLAGRLGVGRWARTILCVTSTTTAKTTQGGRTVIYGRPGAYASKLARRWGLAGWSVRLVALLVVWARIEATNIRDDGVALAGRSLWRAAAQSWAAFIGKEASPASPDGPFGLFAWVERIGDALGRLGTNPVMEALFTQPWAMYVTAGGLLFLSGRMLGRARRARRGVRTERRVLDELAKLDGVRIWCGLRPGDVGGDLDFCVDLGEKVVVVEAKSGRGRVSYRNGVMRAGGRTIPGDPIAQVRREAARAARHFGKPAHPVVCVVDSGEDKSAGDVSVVGIESLRRRVLSYR